MSHLPLALSLAARGYRVLPYVRVTPQGGGKTSKVPQINDWPNKATTDADQIRIWFTEKPRVMPGIACGDGFIVVDVDVTAVDDRPMFSQWALDGGVKADLIPEPIKTISGGKHLFYAVGDPNSFGNTTAANKKSMAWSNVDIRSVGGFVAVHPETFVLEDLPDLADLPPLPDEIREAILRKAPRATPGSTAPEFADDAAKRLGKLREKYRKDRLNVDDPSKLATPAEQMLDALIEEMSTVGEGGRNDTLNRLAFIIANRSLTRRKSSVEDALQELSRAAEESGLEPGEIVATLQSGAAAGRALIEQDKREVAAAWEDFAGATGRAEAKDDFRLVELFAENCGGRIRWTELGWYLWDGTRWAPPGTHGTPGERLREALLPGIAELEVLLRAARRAEEPLLVELLDKDLKDRRAGAFNQPRQARVLKLARDHAAFRTEVPSEAAYRITTPEGWIDLRTLKLHPNTAEHGGLAATPTTWVPGARNRIIQLIQGIYPDRETRRYVRGIAGQTLLGIPATAAVWFDGDGSNGKSVLVGGMVNALGLTHSGGYATIGDEGLLSAGYEGAVARASLAGARLVFIDEVAKTALNTGALKKLVNRDTVAVRVLNVGSGTIKAEYTMIIAVNGVPTPSSRDRGSDRRQVIVRHTETFVEGGQPLRPGEKPANEKYKNEMGNSEWREAFLDLMVWEAHLLLRADRTTPYRPNSIVQATKETLDEGDQVAGFLDDHLIKLSDDVAESERNAAAVKCLDLYHSFRMSEMTSGVREGSILTEKQFRKRVCGHLSIRWLKRGPAGQQSPHYVGVRLMTESDRTLLDEINDLL